MQLISNKVSILYFLYVFYVIRFVFSVGNPHVSLGMREVRHCMSTDFMQTISGKRSVILKILIRLTVKIVFFRWFTLSLQAN